MNLLIDIGKNKTIRPCPPNTELCSGIRLVRPANLGRGYPFYSVRPEDVQNVNFLFMLLVVRSWFSTSTPLTVENLNRQRELIDCARWRTGDRARSDDWWMQWDRICSNLFKSSVEISGSPRARIKHDMPEFYDFSKMRILAFMEGARRYSGAFTNDANNARPID